MDIEHKALSWNDMPIPSTEKERTEDNKRLKTAQKIAAAYQKACGGAAFSAVYFTDRKEFDFFNRILALHEEMYQEKPKEITCGGLLNTAAEYLFRTDEASAISEELLSRLIFCTSSLSGAEIFFLPGNPYLSIRGSSVLLFRCTEGTEQLSHLLKQLKDLILCMVPADNGVYEALCRTVDSAAIRLREDAEALFETDINSLLFSPQEQLYLILVNGAEEETVRKCFSENGVPCLKAGIVSDGGGIRLFIKGGFAQNTGLSASAEPWQKDRISAVCTGRTACCFLTTALHNFTVNQVAAPQAAIDYISFQDSIDVLMGALMHAMADGALPSGCALYFASGFPCGTPEQAGASLSFSLAVCSFSLCYHIPVKTEFLPDGQAFFASALIYESRGLHASHFFSAAGKRLYFIPIPQMTENFDVRRLEILIETVHRMCRTGLISALVPAQLCTVEKDLCAAARDVGAELILDEKYTGTHFFIAETSGYLPDFILAGKTCAEKSVCINGKRVCDAQ